MVRPLIKPTVSCDQQSEYDFTSEEEDHQLVEDQEEESGVEHYQMPVTSVNFNTVVKQKAKNHQFDHHTFCFRPITGSFKIKN